MRQSFTGASWVTLAAPEPVVARLQQSGLSAVAARCAAIRWEEQADAAGLVPSLDHLLDPMTMHGMPEALDRLRKAARDRQRVRIITDYDVDGTTSSLILQAALKVVAPELAVDYHIPHRFTEGYGFSPIAAQAAIDDGIDLVVTADIGVRDHAAVSLAREHGVDVLICDHHLPRGADVPEHA